MISLKIKNNIKNIKPKFSRAVKIKNCHNIFLPFKQAGIFVRKLKLKSWREWQKYCISGKKPNNIPSTPQFVYKGEGWKNIYNWLGTAPKNHTSKNIISFEDAREFARSLKLKSCRKWKNYSKSGRRPKNIPGTPNRSYKDKGWVNWNDWLGVNNFAKTEIHKNFLPYKDAKVFVRKLKLRYQKDWYEYFRKNERPFNIPTSPHQAYKNNGWISWGDWLGTSHLQTEHNRKKYFISFKEAREFVRKLKLEGCKEWKNYSRSEKKPKNIPAAPNETYRNKGWKNFRDWLGTKRFLSFKEARKLARKLKLNSRYEWKEYAKSGKRPKNIPSAPDNYYRNDGWVDFSDWIGIETVYVVKYYKRIDEVIKIVKDSYDVIKEKEKNKI